MPKQEPKPTIEELLSYMAELAHDYAADILIDKPADSQVPPTFTLIKKEGLNTDVFACPWKDDEEKKLMILEVSKQAAMGGATAWSFISETWMARQDPPHLRPFIRPSERPDRKEALMCMVGNGGDNPVKFYTWDIIRDEKTGHVVKLGGVQPDPGSTHSWIANVMNAAVDFAAMHPEINQ